MNDNMTKRMYPLAAAVLLCLFPLCQASANTEDTAADVLRVALPAAAIDRGIGIEHFAPDAVMRQRQAVGVVDLRGEIAHDRDRPRAGRLAQPLSCRSV